MIRMRADDEDGNWMPMTPFLSLTLFLGEWKEREKELIRDGEGNSLIL